MSAELPRGARRRRRAADRPRAEDHPAQRRLCRRGGRDQGARRWRRSPRARPTRSCSTSCCPTGRGSRSARRCGAGAGCRSSSCRPSATSARRCGRSTPGPTTTSPSRSGPTSCWPACARSCAAPPIGEGGSAKLTIGELEIDLTDRRVPRAGEEVHLTPIEFDLVARARAAPRPAGHPPPAAARGVGARVRRWRPTTCACTSPTSAPSSRSIPQRPQYLITEPGVGYRLRDAAE